MLTFLSRSIRRFLNVEPSGATSEPHVRALPAPSQPLIAARVLALPAPRPQLRLVTADGHHDTAIAPTAVHVGAAAFVAGQGARIYSLDAFRTPRTGGGNKPPRRAA